MASTFPAKSRPLHNFCLPQLKWNEGYSGAVKQRRRSIKSPSRRRSTSSASPVRHSPSDYSASGTLHRHQSPLGEYTAASASASKTPVDGEYLGKRHLVSGESLKTQQIQQSAICDDWSPHLPGRDLNSELKGVSRNKEASTECRRRNTKNLSIDDSSNRVSSNPSQRRKTVKAPIQKLPQVPDITETKKSTPKILIKVSRNTPNAEHEDPAKIAEDGDTDEAKLQTTDEETRKWNFRPRKTTTKQSSINGVTAKTNPPSLAVNKSSGYPGGGATEKKEKRELNVSVCLSKEEIEEDIFYLTGSKPTRRPKKRARNIQKDLKSIFPGSWLVSITADSYKVSESSIKG